LHYQLHPSTSRSKTGQDPRLKLDAHGCVLCVFLAHAWVWFCYVASVSDAAGMVCVRVEPASVLTHQTHCSGFRKERYL